MTSGSALVSGSSDQGSCSGLTGPLCCVLGQDTLLSLLVSPPRCVKWIPATLMLEVDLRWTNILSRGE